VQATSGRVDLRILVGRVTRSRCGCAETRCRCGAAVATAAPDPGRPAGAGCWPGSRRAYGCSSGRPSFVGRAGAIATLGLAPGLVAVAGVLNNGVHRALAATSSGRAAPTEPCCVRICVRDCAAPQDTAHWPGRQSPEEGETETPVRSTGHPPGAAGPRWYPPGRTPTASSEARGPGQEGREENLAPGTWDCLGWSAGEASHPSR
jgi:hypothetical protein